MYTATKYAQRGLAETLRVELIPYNIKVSVICPGFTDTTLLDDGEEAKMNIRGHDPTLLFLAFDLSSKHIWQRVWGTSPQNVGRAYYLYGITVVHATFHGPIFSYTSFCSGAFYERVESHDASGIQV